MENKVSMVTMGIVVFLITIVFVNFNNRIKALEQQK